MYKISLSLLFILLLGFSNTFAQFGIKAGLNTANELRSFSDNEIAASFRPENLSGYQIGLIYQAMPKKSGIGVETGALLSQKGSSFNFENLSTTFPLSNGYNEVNYLEVPLNLRYNLKIGLVSIFVSGGIYGSYALSSTSTNVTDNTTNEKTFEEFSDRVDYGYNVGTGIELLQKIQIGCNCTNGIKSLNSNFSTIKNKVFSLSLVYLL